MRGGSPTSSGRARPRAEGALGEGRAVRQARPRRDDVRDTRRRAKDTSTSAEALRDSAAPRSRRRPVRRRSQPAAEARRRRPRAAAAAAVAPGRRLYLPKVRGEVEVLELLGDSRARVAAGALSSSRPPSSSPRALRIGRQARREEGPRGRAAGRRRLRRARRPHARRPATCAVCAPTTPIAMTFLDRAALGARGLLRPPRARDGRPPRRRAGALRERAATRFRPGDTTEGGDGITVVLFA